MAQSQNLPTDLEWFKALELSPDDLDEDLDKGEGARTQATASPVKPPAGSPSDEPQERH